MPIVYQEDRTVTNSRRNEKREPIPSTVRPARRQTSWTVSRVKNVRTKVRVASWESIEFYYPIKVLAVSGQQRASVLPALEAASRR